MRIAIALVLLCPSFAFAQTEDTIKEIEKKIANLQTAKWILLQEAPGGGFYLAPQDPNIDAKPVPSLRATNGAVRALKYLGFPMLKGERERHAAFVLKCYDAKTGGFAEMGGKSDVTITAIGVMVAAELDIPHEKYAKAMDYLKENAKTFEDIRISAAAVEAWGVKDSPAALVTGCLKTAKVYLVAPSLPAEEDPARFVGSVAALYLRLGGELTKDNAVLAILNRGQRDDGGWGKKGEKASDIESTYRVMRALMLLKEKPKETKKLREFIESHRNKDGGYATKPGDKSSMSGAYYCVILSKWLDDMEAKK